MSAKDRFEANQGILARQRLDLVTELMERDDGRAFLWWIMDEGRHERAPFIRDPLEAAYYEGAKNFCYRLQALIRSAGLGPYALMLQEALVEKLPDAGEETEEY